MWLQSLSSYCMLKYQPPSVCYWYIIFLKIYFVHFPRCTKYTAHIFFNKIQMESLHIYHFYFLKAYFQIYFRLKKNPHNSKLDEQHLLQNASIYFPALLVTKLSHNYTMLLHDVTTSIIFFSAYVTERASSPSYPCLKIRKNILLFTET